MWMKSPKGENNPAHASMPPMVIAKELGGSGERGQWEVKKQMLAQIVEMHMKGMTSKIPDSCFFPYIEEC